MAIVLKFQYSLLAISGTKIFAVTKGMGAWKLWFSKVVFNETKSNPDNFELYPNQTTGVFKIEKFCNNLRQINLEIFNISMIKSN